MTFQIEDVSSAAYLIGMLSLSFFLITLTVYLIPILKEIQHVLISLRKTLDSVKTTSDKCVPLLEESKHAVGLTSDILDFGVEVTEDARNAKKEFENIGNMFISNIMKYIISKFDSKQ